MSNEIKSPEYYLENIEEAKELIEGLAQDLCLYAGQEYEIIFNPDLKYYDDKLGVKYSNCNNYFKYASEAIDEMVKQVGSIKIENNIMKKGVIVRHMVMPGNVEDSKKIIKYLYDKYHDDIIISIMNQYTPVRKSKYSELNRRVLEHEYNEVVNYAYDLGIRNAFVQDGDSQNSSFIPDFDKFRVLD